MDALLLHYRKTGQPGHALQTRPPPPLYDVEYYLEAFFRLCKFRGSSDMGGASHLSFRDVAEYADRIGHFSPDDFFLFVDVMAALDDAYLSASSPASS